MVPTLLFPERLGKFQISRYIGLLEKFRDPETTAKGEKRAWVLPRGLKTLWLNTGTLCNLECTHCYIESSPKNDRLVYLSLSDVQEKLKEARELRVQEIGITGGEPFMNPEIIPILNACLEYDFRVLVLTNAMKPMQKKSAELLELRKRFGERLQIRVSVDHYSESLHAKERGERSWTPTLEGLRWLSKSGFAPAVAGRTLWDESETELRAGYQSLFGQLEVEIDSRDPEALVLFPEMDERAEVPEITTKCWEILGVSPDSMMCASARMVVKRKGRENASVVACTLLPYDERFDLGDSVKGSLKAVSLNHPHCAKFCVLGGGSCSKTD